MASGATAAGGGSGHAAGGVAGRRGSGCGGRSGGPARELVRREERRELRGGVHGCGESSRGSCGGASRRCGSDRCIRRWDERRAGAGAAAAPAEGAAAAALTTAALPSSRFLVFSEQASI
ncbi:hypothetical protein ACP70R_015366 [Stipagrostis hirtigluma subsp. patula]